MFDYCPESGVLRWKERAAQRIKIGDVAGTIKGNEYIRVSIRNRLFMVHRVIWLWVTGGWPKNQIDHIDRDRVNNKWANLRDVTQSENQINTGLRVTNLSGTKGVSKEVKRGKTYWLARKLVNGGRVRLGLRKDKNAAIRLLHAE